MAQMKYADFSLYARLLREASPYWLHIVGIFLLSLMSTPLSLLTPLPLKIAVDSAIGSEPLPGFLQTLLPTTTHAGITALALAVGLLVGITLLTGLQTMTSSYLQTYTGENLLLHFRARLFSHVQRFSLVFHDTKGTSDSIYRIMYDASALRHIAVDGVTPFVTAGFTLISMLYIIFRLDRQLAFISLAITPFLFIIAQIWRTRLRSQSRKVKKLESAALSVVQEVLTSIRIVKAFGQEDREQTRFVNHANEGMGARINLTVNEGVMGLLLSLATALGAAGVLFIGVRHVQSGSLTLGELLLVMGYLTQLYGPLKTISKKIASLQNHMASAERAFAFIDKEPDVFERPNARPLVRAKGAMSLHNVTFSYDGTQPVLDDISFEVPAGTRVGIAGETGAGKTTLVSLLTRFYDPTSGLILLDNLDLRDYKVADLRDQFAMVLQEPVLFSTSIAENITYARPGAGQEEIVRAAKAANAHDFIVHLPEGYDTQVGERGMRLSGGERQRLSLARAFLKDAPLLIMDEPTSSVDMKTEFGIMEAMERLMKNRTTFLISHRLTTLQNCDLLLVIEDGKLADVTFDVSTVIKKTSALGGL